MLVSFGQYIKELRSANHLTQQELADAINVSKSYVSLIENDTSPSTDAPPRVSEEKLLRMASVFKIPPHEIFDRAGRVPKGFKFVPVSQEKRNRLRRFGQALRERREHHVDDWDSGLISEEKRKAYTSLEAIANLFGVTPEHLAQLESGPLDNDLDLVEPSLELLDTMAGELQWDLDDMRRILGYEPDQETEDRLTSDETKIVETYRKFKTSNALHQIEYEPILDELQSASYNGNLDSEDVDEITEYIRMKARLRAKKQGRA